MMPSKRVYVMTRCDRIDDPTAKMSRFDDYRWWIVDPTAHDVRPFVTWCSDVDHPWTR